MDIKERAKLLRRKGYSFGEIAIKLSISKSTAYLWCREEVLSKEARERIEKNVIRGRERGIKANRRKRVLEYKRIESDCKVLRGKNISIEDYKIFLALLYWGEGAKGDNRLIFINSDPEMIGLYMFLLRKSFNIKEEKLKVVMHLHGYHSREEMLDFWSKITSIPKNHFYVYNKPNTGINKKPGYKGCLSIRYGDSRILKEVFIIIDRLKQLKKIAGLV